MGPVPVPVRNCVLAGAAREQRFTGGCLMRIDYSPFFRSTVGFDRLIGLLESASEQGYPPYNIERSDENNYRVTLAVAGFAEKDLSVDVKDRVLTITRQARGEPRSRRPPFCTRASPAAPLSAASSLPSMSRSRLPAWRTACCMSTLSASCRRKRSPAASRSMRRSSRPSRAARRLPKRPHRAFVRNQMGHPLRGMPHFLCPLVSELRRWRRWLR